MKSLSNLIVEDINILYNSIYNEEFTEEDKEIVEDIVSTISLSMIYEGYSAKAIQNFFENASYEELFYKYETFDESLISESTLPEEYIEEQIDILNEVIGALLRVGKAAFQAAKHAPKGQKLAAAFKGGGTAATRVGTQGTRQSSVVRSTAENIKNKTIEGAKKVAPTIAAGTVGGVSGYVGGKASSSESSSSKPADSPKWNPKDTVVVARKDGKQGKLNKTTGEWKPEEWGDEEQKRYQKEKEKLSAESYTPYDIILNYLFDNGHVDTLDEAHYVMLEMDAETIQSIVEEYDDIAPKKKKKDNGNGKSEKNDLNSNDDDKEEDDDDKEEEKRMR